MLGVIVHLRSDYCGSQIPRATACRDPSSNAKVSEPASRVIATFDYVPSCTAQGLKQKLGLHV